MSNQYGDDDIEHKFGISAYASSHEGFAAVAKARYSDFLVHEVDVNGNIARLESLETPPKVEASVEASTPEKSSNADTADDGTRKRKLSESADVPKPDANTDNKVPKSSGGDIKVQEAGKPDWVSLGQDLSKLIGEVPAQEAVSFLQKHESDSVDEPKAGDEPKFYTLPLISDKQVRRSIHMLVKSPALSLMARADNHDGRIRIWHKKFQGDMPKDTHYVARGGDRNRNSNPKKDGRGGGGYKSAPWPKDRPNFLRFVLYKENIDTTTAAKDVGWKARLNPKRGINYAGMKDKRGITAQFCSAYRVEKEQLLAVNKEAPGSNNAGGGNTTNNGSAIVKLGNFAYSSDEVKIGGLSGNRFDIVLRNVDIGEVDVDGASKKQLVQQKLETAGKALQSNGFINYFGMQRFGKFFDTHEVGIAILKGEFEGAIDIIMRQKPDELSRYAGARKQWAERFKSIDVSKDENAAREAERKCARAIQRNLGRFMNCENAIVYSLAGRPRDYKRAFGSIGKNMRSMFLHAYQSYIWNKVASHRVEAGGSTNVRVGDLVLIEDRPEGKGGGGTSGLKGKAVKMIDEQDLKDGKYSITDVVLPLAGSKIQYPGGSAGDLYKELMKKDGISTANFVRIGNMDREIALKGDYRKLMCKPNDVSFEVKSYTEPLQPLLQTDLMRVNGIDITATTLCSSQEAVDGSKVEGNQDEENVDTIFGMAIGFSLPPSSYATIALRELTKRPTSSNYQSKLELSGKCERNINAEPPEPSVRAQY